MNYEELRDYFEQLAIRCPSINHTQSNSRFESGNWEMVVNTLKNKVTLDDFWLILDLNESKPHKGTFYKDLERKIGLTVLRKVDHKNQKNSLIQHIVSECERILYQILWNMSQDMEEGCIPSYFSLENVRAHRIDSTQHYSCDGWYAEFPIRTKSPVNKDDRWPLQ